MQRAPDQLLSVIPSLPAALVKQVGQKWEALSVLQAQQRELSNLILQTIREPGGGGGALENLPLFVSDSQEGFFLCSLLLPRLCAQQHPCTSALSLHVSGG